MKNHHVQILLVFGFTLAAFFPSSQAEAQFSHEGTLTISVREEAGPTPARITIVGVDNKLPDTTATSDGALAVRPGVVYTVSGEAQVVLRTGTYTIYGGRGFEYSLDRKEVTVNAGETVPVPLTIRREVPTEGYVACDPHVHTVTHSGHGDCTIEERMATLAGEGIELPIATDHNKHVDYTAATHKTKTATFFTPIIGNEVTTKLGHFNAFPMAADAPVPDVTGTTWKEVFRAIKSTPKVRAIILNHARDIHNGMRPFDPEIYDEATGAMKNGWTLEANAMEILNSGATQSELLQLTKDWMTQLNRGHRMTPVGSSDSHDVNTYIVGQGRTYIRVDDTDPGNIDVDAAVDAFVAGQVMVSYGLLAEMKVNGTVQSGDLATLEADAQQVSVGIRVLGPHWAEASQVQLYANGKLVREESIHRETGNSPGIIWTGEWIIDRPQHDVHLVAIATGPGIEAPWWQMAEPYQPTSPIFVSQAFGCSGAVWLDDDGDGK